MHCIQKKSIALKVFVLFMAVCIFIPGLSYSTNSVPETVYTGYDIQVEIPLADDTKGIKVSMPVEGKSKAEVEKMVKENSIALSLIRDTEKKYLDENLFPAQSSGGSIQNWKTMNNTPQFTNIAYEVKEQDGKVYLDVTFDANVFFYSYGKPDYSVPHTSSGTYMDICGYFVLTAFNGETNIGEADVKITPYLGFHTMDEIYTDIKDITSKGTAKGLYAKEFSLGTSTGGRNMPYMIIAKDENAVNQWLSFADIAETNPEKALNMIESGEADNLKVPLVYTNVHANEVAAADGIMDFAKKLVTKDTIEYKNLVSFTDTGKAQLEAELASNGLAVPELIKDDASYLGYIQAGNGKSGKVNLEEYYNIETKNIKVDELLEDVFFILVPEENVDGRTFFTRAADNGYDLNRDNSFQTTSETANMQKMIGAFNPVSLVELHGRVTDFQCEPCSPPHEPNFEYDLLAENLMEGGEAFGIAAVANNESFNSYVIPQRDYLTKSGDEDYWQAPWDDMSTSYTPQFAMLQGTVAYTVELPAYSKDTVLAASYGILGQADYIGDVKLDYIKAQTEIYKRGVNNYNSNGFDEVGQWLVDQYDVEGAEMELFRPEYNGEDENGNFYPECYVIPLDSENQVNVASAAAILKLLSRNDVKINITESSFKLDGKEYPKGTAVVSMYQAKRSVANGLLYDGTFIQTWSELYSEGITAFNKTRGFDMVTVTKPKDYEKIVNVMGEPKDYENVLVFNQTLSSSFTGIENADVIIDNSSEESTAAINELLKSGADVALITEGEHKSDFICSYENYMTIKDKFIIKGEGVYGEKYKASKIIKAPTVFIAGVSAPTSAGFINSSKISNANWNYDRVAMELMNFDVTTDLTQADVIVGASKANQNVIAQIQNGTPYIGYSKNVKSLTNLLPNLAYNSCSNAMDCLGYVTYPENTLTNASYISEEDNIMYGYGAGYFSQIPEGAKVLVQMDGSKEPMEGFIPTLSADAKTCYDKFINGSIQGFEYVGKDVNGNDIDVTLFANTLTNKVHQRDEYSFISNYIFSKNLGDDYQGAEVPEDTDVEQKDPADKNTDKGDNTSSDDEKTKTYNEKIKTGDGTNIVIWIVLLVVAIAIMTADYKNKKKIKNM